MKFITLLIVSLVFTGCASVSKWEPTLNTKISKNSAAAEQDVAECRVLANNAAGFGMAGLTDTIAGAAGGAATGAIVGALITSPAGPAAAAGGALGAFGGLFYGEYEADLTYKRAFSNCLFQRGQFPIN